MQLDRYLDRGIEDPKTITSALIENLEGDFPYMGQRRWRAEDFYGLTFVALLDRSIDSGRLTEGVPERLCADLLGKIATFHAALPFAENERHMIVQEYDELKYPTGLRDDVRAHIPRQEICVEGTMRTTSGRELMERWWSWRHGRDAYEGGQGVATALGAVMMAHGYVAEA